MAEAVITASDDITVSGNADEGLPVAADPDPAVVAAADGDPEPEPADEPDPASDAGKTLAGKKKSLNERLNQVTGYWRGTQRERDAAKAEADKLRAELDTLRRPAAQAPAPAAAPAVDPAKPRLKAFTDQIGTTYESYEDAVDAHGEALYTYKRGQETKDAQAKTQQDAQAAVYRTAQERISTFKAAHPDYDEKVNNVMVPPGPGAEQLVAHLTFSEFGPQLAYELAGHPDELARMASLQPAYVLEALGELKATIKARQTPAPTGPGVSAPTKTHANPPIKPVSGSPVTSDDDGDPDDLSEAAVAAHVRRENAKELKRRRG